MPSPVGKRELIIAFFRPSVAYIATNSRTRKPSEPKFGMKVLHIWCDSYTNFKVKRSRSPGPLILTHIVRHIFRTARPTNLGIYGWRTTTRIMQPQALWPPRSKVKVARSRSQGHVISLSRLGPMPYRCRVRWGHTVSAEPGGHTSCETKLCKAAKIMLGEMIMSYLCATSAS